MKSRSKRNIIIAFTGAILVVAFGIWIWNSKVSPTKVALISYPDYRIGKIQKANSSKWVKIIPIEANEMRNLDSYDFILVFPYGLQLNSEQKGQLAQAGKKGTAIFRLYRPDGINNLSPRHKDAVSAYLKNLSSINYHNFLNYVRREIGGKKLFTKPIEAARELSANLFFYKNEETIFKTLDEFTNYCQTNNIHKQGAKRIIIYAGMPGPFDTGFEQYAKIIDAFEQKGYNVFPYIGSQKRIEYIKEIKPDAVLYFPVGSLAGGKDEKLLETLKSENIPLFSPLGLYSIHDDWIKNRGRMNIVMSSQRVVSPELNGAIVPYAVCAQYTDNDGYLVFDVIPERLPKFTQLVDNFVKLQQKENSNKKVAIVYYKGPGKNAMGGAGLEGIPSLYNTLLKLKAEGYSMNGFPNNYEDFKEILNKKGKVFGAYAEGAFNDYITAGYPEMVAVNEYKQWGAKILEPEMWKAVNDKYGQAEDGFMVARTDSMDFMAISRIQFQNVVVMPLPMAGYGSNTFEIIHGTEMPPPHAYLAPYFWLQEGFKTDAIIHFGTHGSLEFLHGKQIALSPYDWPDPLIGSMPHFYFYNISAVGEGIIAKRRSYATLVSHLTPPFMESDALKESELLTKISKHGHTEGALQQQYALSVKKLVVEKGIHIDLGLDDDLSKPYTHDEMHSIEHYLDEVSREKITGKLYELGTPYTHEEAKQTARLMHVNGLSYNLAKLDLIKGKISHKEIDNSRFISKHYTNKSDIALLKVLEGANAKTEFSKLISSKDFKRAQNWRKNKKEDAGKGDMMQMMMSMAGQSKGSSKGMKMSGKRSSKSGYDKEQLQETAIKIAAQSKHKEYILKLQSKEDFERASAFLDPEKKENIRKMARMIPDMKEALEIAEDSTVNKALQLMQNPETKEALFSLLKNDNLEEDVRKQKAINDSVLYAKALRMPYKIVLMLNDKLIESSDYITLEKYSSFLDFYNRNSKSLRSISEELNTNEAKNLNRFLTEQLQDFVGDINHRIEVIENTEADFANAVFSIRESLTSVHQTYTNLLACPDSELDAMINALNGGYIAPSPGGDPITTPQTVPTGRNLYSVNVTSTPTKEAWEVGKRLGNSMLADYQKKHGKYPRKVSFTLWSGSFIESEGTTIAEILYLLGAEPVWTGGGSVTDVRLIPAKELTHPRIDVIIQTSGQFRDLADSRLFLIQKAIELAALDKETEQNFIAEGIRDAEQRLIEKGFSPKEARELSTSRIFGGVNNIYGAGIMDMVESSGNWDSTSVVAKTYIHNMGAIYGKDDSWSDFHEGVFEAALLNTDAVVQPRQSNTWGPLSLDHVYEFMGGINLAVKEVTGNDAESYFNDYRNASYAKVQNLNQAIWAEARTTMLNPKFIKERMKGEASATEDFAEVFRNSFGWNVMKPGAIDNQLWDKYYEVYVEDEMNTGIGNFFKDKNPYAYQEMTAVMLETIRKELWDATPEQLKTLAELHTELVNDFDAGCSGFVCDNAKLQHFIENQIENIEHKEKYAAQTSKVREASDNTNNESVVLRKEKQENVFTNLNINLRWILIGFAIVLLLLIIFVKRRRR